MASSASNSARPKARVARGCGGFFFFFMLVAGAAWGAGIGVMVFILDDTDETIRVLDDFRPKIGSRIYSSDGEELGTFTDAEVRTAIGLNEIPLMLQKAFIATEDHTFFEHKGVQPLALASVGIEALRTGNIRGASTITQQIVRNIEQTGISKEVSIQRKVREMIFALQLERQFTKDEILELYLNQIFLGVSAYGVESAARQYFAKPVSDLTLAECATLAGLTRSPNNNNPFASPENAVARRNIVLDQMLRHEFITQAEYDEARAARIEDYVVTPEERDRLIAEGKYAWAPGKFKAPYFVEEARKFIARPPAPHQISGSPEDLYESGLEITTTIDMRIQRAAEAALIAKMDEFDAEKRAQLERRGQLDEFAPISGAVVVLDNRPGFEGFVRAMVGGRDFDTNKFNNATQAERQPGSSVKPFVWLCAIDNGMTPSSIVVDEPIVRYDGLNRPYRPKNFDPDFLGPIPIRLALEKSVNIVSIKLTERFGFPLVRSYLVSAGFKKPIGDEYRMTIGLGTPVTTILDHAVCYSTLAHMGTRWDPVMVLEIKDRDGFTRYNYRDFPRRHPNVLPADAVYAVVNMMQAACQADGRLGHYPTGHRTADLARPRAGKTGTTNDARDTWFCGFTPQFTCIVWFGYYDNRSIGRGADYTGGRMASPVWTEVMKAAHEGLPVEEFEVPPGVEFFGVERFTGLAGNQWRGAFIRGTKPPTEMPLFELSEEAERELEANALERI